MEHLILHTGQHYDTEMSDRFFREMEIPKPDLHLEVKERTHGAMTGKMLQEVEKGILDLQPDLVMVYGDTNSTVAGALAAVKMHIPVAHVEAGLRSFNMRMPEEINRISTDRISSYLFCPTTEAVRQLKREGFAHEFYNIYHTGDVMLDAVHHYRQKAELPEYSFNGKPVLLCTIHRPSNTDDPDRLERIVELLDGLAANYDVVFPMHPRLRSRWDAMKRTLDPIAPVSYFQMLALLEKASIVLTDSGGLQKEAYFFGKPCLTLRKETEWVELVNGGFNVLVEPDLQRVEGAIDQLGRGTSLPFDQAIYGNGHAAEEILDILVDSI
jgi:UDP-GlcNAc3NAcA epimerase